jgi:hypothetical protein
MKNVLLVDFHNLLFRIFFIKDVGGYTVNPEYSLWRYLVYESVYKMLYNIDDITEVVIAVDDKNSWRKSYFPRYKESRKKDRDKSDIDWDRLFEEMNNLVADLKHHMPFKVIKIRSAEADDIIAVISQEIGCNCVVSSNDEDYLQLCSDRIKVWNPSKKKYSTCENTEKFIIKKCLTGQRKDDIFNVKMNNDWGLTEDTKGKRRPPLGEVTANKIMAGDYKKWLEDNELEDNFHRNRVLMDFNYIPQTIRKRVMDIYNNYRFPPPGNIYQFFKKYNMRGFLDDYTSVENKLMGFY